MLTIKILLGKLAGYGVKLVVAAALVTCFADPGLTESVRGPGVNVVEPENGVEVKPDSDVKIVVEATDEEGILSAELFWGKLNEWWPCHVERGNRWRCEHVAGKFIWHIELGDDRDTRHYKIRITDRRGNSTTTYQRSLRVSANPTGISLALRRPLPGSSQDPGSGLLFEAEAHTTTSSIIWVRIRLNVDPLYYYFTRRTDQPHLWEMRSTVAARAEAGSYVFHLQAGTAHGVTATAGPFRLQIGNDDSEGNFTVFRVSTASITGDEAAEVLKQVNELLAKDNDRGGYDTECPLSAPLRMRGSVREFSFGDGDSIVEGQKELYEILNRPGRGVYVVNELNYCKINSPAAGCALTGENGPIVVERRSSSFEPVLWAHEFGHTRGLSHRTAYNERGNVMHKVQAMPGYVYNWQRQKYQAPLLFSPNEVGHSSSSDFDAASFSLLDYISHENIDGYLWESMSRFSWEHVPELIEHLRSRNPDISMSSVVSALGMIGDVRAIQPLVEFVDQHESQVSFELYRAKREALFALGLIIAQSSPAPNLDQASAAAIRHAVDFLMQRSDPARWSGILNWPLPYQAPQQLRDRQMARAALRGLAVSGSSEAPSRLRHILTLAPGGAGIAQEQSEYLLEELLDLNGRINRLGVREAFGRVN